MKVIFFVTEDWYFCSHRLALARTLKRAGHEVVVAAKASDFESLILSEGLQFIEVDFFRQAGGWLEGLRTLARMITVCRQEQPDVVHNIALKPVLLGTLAARISGVPSIINTVAGLGHVFISKQVSYRLVRFLLLRAMKILFKAEKIRIIVQNRDDLEFFRQHRIVLPKQLFLIPGAGVDVIRFCPAKQAPAGAPVVVCHSRMLWTKGVREFVEAAKILKAGGCSVRMVLVGAPDPGNPESVPISTLERLQEEGAVEYWGFRKDIDQVLKKSTIAVLPSYREGLPKSLLEAAATGLPLVAFDVPGCREIVHHGETGLLVPSGDSNGLAAAIRTLLDSPSEQKRMGENGRNLVLQRFDQESINQSTAQVCFASKISEMDSP